MKTEKRKLKDKLEKIVKEIVKIRDEYKCQHCHKQVSGVDCHGSHVIPISRDGRLAFDPLNIKVLCYHCHLNWWHKHPIESGEWFTSTFPERWYYLERKYQQNAKGGSIPIAWYKEQIEIYTEILEEYRNKY
jgi:5-methylcytosine-specific restriction endonuclease McrA